MEFALRVPILQAMQFFRRFWEKLFGRAGQQQGLIGLETSYYEKFFGKENELMATNGKDGYDTKVYDTDKYFIQLIFNKNLAIVKNYIDKMESINFRELQNLIRTNFLSFDPKYIGYNLSSNQIVQINSERDKAIILNHQQIVPLNDGSFAGTFPLRSVLFVIDQQLLRFLVNNFNSGTRIP